MPATHKLAEALLLLSFSHGIIRLENLNCSGQCRRLDATDEMSAQTNSGLKEAAVILNLLRSLGKSWLVRIKRR